MTKVRAKKHLGQHFLTDLKAAQRIAESLTTDAPNTILEIGPGMGVLTQFLLQNERYNVSVVEIDTESVTYLKEHYPQLEGKIIEGDFLKLDLTKYFQEPFTIIGNFPYNISSQILFKVLEHIDLVPQFAGMFQKEVAQRIASGPGTKDYGILSVLLQAYYNIEYLFTVNEGAFNPPPKVKSGVIRLMRNERTELPCDAKLFKQVVKMGFNQRRKTLSNSLKGMLGDIKPEGEIFRKRPEQLSVEEFFDLTIIIENIKNNA